MLLSYQSIPNKKLFNNQLPESRIKYEADYEFGPTWQMLITTLLMPSREPIRAKADAEPRTSYFGTASTAVWCPEFCFFFSPLAGP